MNKKNVSPVVTIKDVAAAAGVSAATVSNVLRGRRRVQPEYAERVMTAVKALGYRADQAASRLRSGDSRVIAMVVPSIENPFFSSVVAAVERCCREDDYELIVASSDNDCNVEESRISALASWKPAGFILVPGSFDFPARHLLESSGTPYVLADRWIDGVSTDSVTVDNHGAGAMAASHLIQLQHQRIVVVASDMRLRNIQERIAGINRVLHQHHLEPAQPLEVGVTLEDASASLQQWFCAEHNQTAYIALTNFATLALLGALSRAGVTVPDQASVVGFDDYVWMQMTAPSVTALRQPVEQMGSRIWEQLLARIHGDDAMPRHVQFPCELIVRDSTTMPAEQGSLSHQREGF